jgi:phosphate transport system permease protein
MPLLAGTFLITIIALIVSTPIGIFSAVFLSEYVSNKLRFILKPIIEMLSGIPTVVYGYFAALYMGPYIRSAGESWNLDVSSESALAAGVVLGIMIIPYIISLADDMLKSIPANLRDASLALGATKFETIAKIIIPAAKSGLIGAVMLAFSRAIGETMIVTMASGLTARLTANPLNSVTTVTAQIVSILTGDQEFNSIKTLAAFALAFTLFCLTLILNAIAHNVMTKYKSQFR